MCRRNTPYRGIHRDNLVIVEDEIVSELKCVDHLLNEHTAQCLNYLKASGRKLALLINFQCPKVEWKRIVREL